MGIEDISARSMKVLIVLTVAISVACSSPAPQISVIKDLFRSLSGSDKSGEDNGDYETVPYKTLNKTILDDLSYEIREYPSVNWACTELTYKQEDNDYVKEDENTSEWSVFLQMQMMNSLSWKKSPSSKMFMKLFRYISGVNVERQEIEMTTPVLSTLTPTEDGMMKNKMCFYLDSSAQDNPPTPETSDVFIERNKPLIVAVYEFGGYAMTDDVWEAEAAIFAQRLGDRVNSVDTNSFYTAGYDSPMKFWNRKNEVMFKVIN